MIQFVFDAGFEKALARCIRKHPEQGERIKEKLRVFQNDPFAQELRNHKLTGALKDCRAVSIGSDLRLLYQELGENKVLLIDIGTHDEVY